MNKFLEKYNIILANPQFLWLLLLLPILLWLQHLITQKRKGTFNVSTTEGLQNIGSSWKTKLISLPTILNSIAYLFLALAIARPQQTNVSENIESEGIDIVLSMDISGSMLAEDFKPNRLEAAKNTAIEFVKNRKTDRIGVVIFAGESFTLSPITIDENVVLEQISNIKRGMVEEGTAIGMGLATAVDRLRDAKGKSRVVILMTDGVNNSGIIDPQTALEIAKALNVKVYTIGVGTIGEALYPVPTPFGEQKQMVPVQIDEDLLKKIAAETGGKYFRATNNKSLQKIYNEIDALEKTKIEVSSFKEYKDLFFPLAVIALAAIVLATLLRYTLLSRFP